MIPESKRIEFWDYLLAEKRPRPKGVTTRRLLKVRQEVIADDFFWDDVIYRFGATHVSAREFYGEERRFASDQSRSNFWAMVREKISSHDKQRD